MRYLLVFLIMFSAVTRADSIYCAFGGNMEFEKNNVEVDVDRMNSTKYRIYEGNKLWYAPVDNCIVEKKEVGK